MRLRPAHLIPFAFWAGLATGLLRFGAPAGAILLLAAFAVRGMPRLLLGVALLGAAAGLLAWRREAASCAAVLPAARLRLPVRLLEPVDAAGGRVQVDPRFGCTGSIVARWPERQPLDAGTLATVEGRWIPRDGPLGRPTGTLVISTVRVDGHAPTPGERLRNAASAASRTLYGRRSPVVEALVLGRRSGIDPDLLQRFADAGIVHLLSISGFHVGLVAGWVLLLGRLARLGPVRPLVLGAATSLCYVAWLGWPAPATRAAALGVCIALARIRQRHLQPTPLLLQTCLVVTLVDPWALADLGGWLSASALWGATALTRWSDRALGERWWWRTLAASVGATAATAPLTAAALGSVALVGIVLNFGAIPIAALAVPGVIASLLLQPILPALAAALAAGAGFLLHLLELLAAVGAAVPGGHLVQEGGWRSAVPWLVVLGLLLWGAGTRNPAALALRRWGWTAAAAAWAALAVALAPVGDTPDALSLHFLDVGQGDAAVLRTPRGRWVVIDAGPTGPGPGRDAGRMVVVPFLRRAGARAIDALAISHAHADHLGGAAAVLARFPTGLVLEPGELVADPLYRGFLDDVATRGVRWRAGRPGERFTIDDVRFTILHPDTAWAGWGADLNEDSLVLLIEYGAFRALFGGDVGFPAESVLAGRVGRVSLLKVGHHGSAGSTSDRWLAELRPPVAVVSVGARNRYGHPAPGALRRLAEHGVAVHRTDREGTVTVTTDGAQMTVRSRSGTAEYRVTP